MKLLLGTLTVLMMMTSQASTHKYADVQIGQIAVTSLQAKTATKNVPVLASVPRIPKYKILRANPYRITHIIIDGSDDDYIDDEGLITSYRRRDLNKVEHEEGLSEEIEWRLFLARQLALMKYREVHG